jgi:putative transposase
MPDYRRAKLTGGSFFFTLVTFNHLPILTGAAARKLLHDAWVDTREHFLFHTEAVVLLPDHLHTIWTLPEGDANFSVRYAHPTRMQANPFLCYNYSGIDPKSSAKFIC